MIKFFIILILLLPISFAKVDLETPQITTFTTVDSKVIENLNFFNDGSAKYFTATLQNKESIISIISSPIFVEENSYGSFSLNIDTSGVAPGIYFNKISIFGDELLFDVPVISVIEDKSFDQNHDVIIDIQSHDISDISGEMLLSPGFKVHKLDYDTRINNLLFNVFVYSINGDLIYSSEESIHVSRTTEFERFINLGLNVPEEVIIVGKTESNGFVGYDIAQLNTRTGEILLSPIINEKDYSYWIYLGIFTFLIASIIVLSYFWNHRVITQAREWKTKLDDIKKYQFSDSGKAIRKLASQKEVLQRAHSMHFISNSSYIQGISEIEKMSSNLRKRL